MKKILISFPILLGATLVSAQKSNGAKTQIVSNEDPHNPLVNGIPYSQYKMQVQVVNKQRAEQKLKAEAEQKKELEKMNSIKIQPMEQMQNPKSEETTNSKK